MQTALQRVMQGLLALHGLTGESMVRDVGWRFMDGGRRIERAVQLLSLLRATVTEARGTATDSLVLESVLLSAESIITYRRRYRSQAQLQTLLDLLLLDAGNPRSLAYQLERLTEDLDALPTAERRPPARGAAPGARGLDDAPPGRHRGARASRTSRARGPRWTSSSASCSTGCCGRPTPSRRSTSST